jgi:hypothetical protein
MIHALTNSVCKVVITDTVLRNILYTGIIMFFKYVIVYSYDFQINSGLEFHFLIAFSHWVINDLPQSAP